MQSHAWKFLTECDCTSLSTFRMNFTCFKINICFHSYRHKCLLDVTEICVRTCGIILADLKFKHYLHKGSHWWPLISAMMCKVLSPLVPSKIKLANPCITFSWIQWNSLHVRVYRWSENILSGRKHASFHDSETFSEEHKIVLLKFQMFM
jgi:hypothetical protein